MLWWFAQTSMVTAGLAALAWGLGRSKRLGPEVRHFLWLVVLIKFATPPVVAWPWSVPDAWPGPPAGLIVDETARADPPRRLEPPVVEPEVVSLEETRVIPLPESDPLMVAPSSIEAMNLEEPLAVPEAAEAPRSATPPPTTPVLDADPPRSILPRLLLGLWLAGSIVVAGRRAWTILRFRRSIADSEPGPGWLVEEARTVGDRLGVRSPPVLVSSGVVSPMLWCLGRPRLILPGFLVKLLAADRWPVVFAHELAHLARGDHWVVRLELLVEVFWWWNPVFHLTRKRLRIEAEHAADARVLRALPDRRFAYAEALVDICEHLARSAIPSPALGVGGPDASRSLEGRLLMILGGPIPRSPGPRAALAAVLLTALALPAWTLGQQPDAPAKPAATDPFQPVQPEAPKAVVPPTREWTLEEIQAGFAGRLSAELKALSFRYSVASRDQVSGTNQPGETVDVRVADVILASKPMGAAARLDVFSSLYGESLQNPGSAWTRRFVAKDGNGFVTFETSPTQTGPVSFRWQSNGNRPMLLGDNLEEALSGQMRMQPVDRSSDPLDPRPANVLDLDGSTVVILSPTSFNGQAQVAGTDVIEGREVVRLAWFVAPLNGGGLRGLLWVAPSLNFAVVRSEAAQDATPNGGMMSGRKSWRKTSSDFVEVGGLWLPRKVESRNSEATMYSNQAATHEMVVTLEDYQANPDLPTGAFHPKFKIEALDEKTGDFTTIPPEPPPGLVDRLVQAVRESPFGPPRIPASPNRTTAVSKPDAAISAPRAEGKPQAAASPPPTDVTPRKSAQPGRSPFDLDLNPAVVDGDLAKVIERRFLSDPEVVELSSRMTEARRKVDNARRATRVESDPAVRNAVERLKSLEKLYEELWDKKSKLFAEPAETAREEFALLKSRRDGKAAEVSRAEAKRDLAKAVVQRNTTLMTKGPNYVSREELTRAEAELQVAEAELAGKKADLAGADVGLNQASRRLGLPVGAEPVISTMTGSPSTLADLRDFVELMEIQLQGKQAELRAVEPKKDLASHLIRQAKGLVDKNLVGADSMVKAEADYAMACAELDQKKAEVLEFEVRLKQAKRRAEAEEARIRRAIPPVKARLEWSDGMRKKGYVSKTQNDADRAAYDELMFQVDPKHVPTPAPVVEPETPGDTKPQ